MLLESKFFQPRPRQEILLRPHLLERLQEGLQCKLILVLSQAGFGKSTLVAQWFNTLTGSHKTSADSQVNGQEHNAKSHSTKNHRVAWLSLDGNDNDPVRFFDYLVAALQRVDATIGVYARGQLTAPQPSTNLEPLVISLLNDLTNLSNTGHEHFVLALDDYHTITSQEVHHIIHTLINHAPPHFHLLLISRTEPPLPLTRWRMHRDLLEIRENDLRFRLDEATTYLLETMHCTISHEDVAALELRTEGWIVGLHLAALSLQSRPDAAAFITEFTGNHAYLVDYLTEEVLQRQPSEIQEFLLQTSLLARFNSALLDAVLERTGSQRILEYLERSHLFVIPLDSERGWYRYHHLFAEMLRRRVQEDTNFDSAQIYRRAAKWYADKELTLESIDYALAAEDYANAITLIEQAIPTLLVRGHFVTLMQWFNRLPSDVLRSRPALCVTRARVAMRQQRLDEAAQWIDHTWQALAQQTQPDQAITQSITAEAYALGIDLALNRGQLDETIQLSQKALAIIPEEFIRTRGEILFFLSIAYYWLSRHEEAEATATQAARLATRAEDTLTAIYAWTNLARYAYTQGKLRNSLAALEQAWALASQHHAQQMVVMGSYHNNMGQIMMEWNQLDAAESHYLQSIHISEQSQNPRTLLRGYSLILPIYQAKGEFAKADEMLQRAQQIMRDYELSAQIIDECSRTIIQKWLGDGNLLAVGEWVEKRGLLPSDVNNFDSNGLEDEYLLVARYLIKQNKLAEAAALLERVSASAKALDKRTIGIAIQSEYARVLYQMGETRRAASLLADTLEEAEPEGFIRTFLDAGLDAGYSMQSLLTDLQPQLAPKLRAYVAQLLQAFGSPTTPLTPRPSTPVHPISPQNVSATHTFDDEFVYIERLSERELEVLRLVNEGMSDSQIAAKLILAIGTVKRHLNNIYGKLGVHNRTHALARARALNLL